MKKEDLSVLSDSDIIERIGDEREALAKMKFNHTVSGMENPMDLRNQRRTIARLLTEMNNRSKNS